MRRLKKFIIIFCLALAFPLGYFIVRTQEGLRGEEMEELRFFTETLLDQMEEDLADLVRREEARSIDEYSYYLSESSERNPAQVPVRSPLSELPRRNYILGYFQMGPDGTLQTPLLRDQKLVPAELEVVIDEMRKLASSFSRKKSGEEGGEVHFSEPTVVQEQAKTKEYGIGSRYLKAEQYAKKKSQLGREEKRIEKLSAAQVQNITQQAPISQEQGEWREKEGRSAVSKGQDTEETWESEGLLSESAMDDAEQRDEFSFFTRSRGSREQMREALKRSEIPAASLMDMEVSNEPRLDTYRAEIDPLQSVVVDPVHVFIFRRIVLDDHIYRQGFILKMNEFLDYLGHNYFSNQPLARFAGLRLLAAGPESTFSEAVFGSAVALSESVFHLRRVFPRPFSFLSAGVYCDEVPESAGRKTVGLMMGILAGVVLLGLLAIYRSARVVLEMSERRTGFVSSVTHELKTPLTNIRMYIEMLEHGIAGSKEREAEYFRILRSESERLTRLINNVLEFSKLEKKQRRIQVVKGDLEEVVAEVRDVMGEKIKREGFVLEVEKKNVPPILYDREAMVQILINLIDNSIKFGRNEREKKLVLTIEERKGKARIALADTGPGLPQGALKKVFEEFYRVDNSLTRSTKGTGIGLALVKKLTTAMGGDVMAQNNQGAGCTITLLLPLAN